MKNACIIAPFPPPLGGDAKAVQLLIESDLVKKELNIEKINLSDGTLRSSGNRNLKTNKIRIVLNAIKKINKISNKTDVYYLTIAQSFFGSIRDLAILSTIYRKKTKNAKVIIHLHGGGFKLYFESTNKFMKKSIKKTFSKVDKAIVLSSSLRSMFDSIVSEEKICIVENCVDNLVYPNSVTIENKIKEIVEKKTINVIFLSNMILSKGYFDILKAANILNEINDSNIFQFYFAGAFPSEEEKKDFYQYIDKKQLKSKVKHLGTVEGEKKNDFLKQGDIFVLPTYFPPEGQPISILEAMAYAMPIITTSHGGISDVIVESINGLYVEKKNPTDLAYSLIELAENRKKMKKIAIQNRATVEKKYLEKNYIEKMIKILKMN